MTSATPVDTTATITAAPTSTAPTTGEATPVAPARAVASLGASDTAGRPGLLARILRRDRRSRRRHAPASPLGYHRPTSSGSLDLSAMSARIAEAGPAASPALLAEVARRAHAHGMASPAVGILTDTTAPEVVRTRAFAVVATRLATTRPGLRPEAAA